MFVWLWIVQASMQQDKKYRILLADDNFDMREYLGRLLSEKYEVVTVCDGTVTHDTTRHTHGTPPTQDLKSFM
jgi:PleD family two-component response regulator